MIVLLMTLWSFCAVYFSHLLTVKKMKVAAIASAILYIYVIAWTYAVFIIDIADLGFAETETRVSLLHGSNIYHSFVQLNAKMAAIPLPILKAIVAVAAMTLVAGFIVAFHGIFEISREICRFVKQYRYLQTHKTEWIIKNKSVSVRAISIIRLYCRANC